MTTRFAEKPEPGALATQVPPPSDYGGTVQPPPQVHTIVTGGMPGWQILLIAVAAAVIAATVAVILDRARAARRRLTAPTARACHTETVAARQPVTAARPRHARNAPTSFRAANGSRRNGPATLSAAHRAHPPANSSNCQDLWIGDLILALVAGVLESGSARRRVMTTARTVRRCPGRREMR
jgi:hypothetical protein